MFTFIGYLTSWYGSFRMRLVVTAVCGLLLILGLHHWLPSPIPVAVLSAYAALLAALLVAGMEHACQERLAELLGRIDVPLGLAPDHEMFQAYRNIASGLVQLTQQTDPVLREIAVLRLTSICAEIQALAQGTVVFGSTETWRIAYEKLLTMVSVKAYFSVAWVKTADYWRDVPGKRSICLNHELVDRGYHIERVAIVSNDLWPVTEKLPCQETFSWLKEQSDHGIYLRVVRESELGGEPDLLRDFGIYGAQAVGEQELDDRCRTLRFNLRFDEHSIQAAHDRWERLTLYTTKFSDLLDQAI